MKRAAAYLRVSDERQDEFSPDSQLKLIREFCDKNELFINSSSIFYDDGISAKSSEGRPEFRRMIELAKLPSHPFDVIVVWKFSRFARNQEESIMYKSLLRKRGVEVVSVSEPIGNDPFGSLVERIIEWMDEYYLVRLSGEVKRGMKEKALRGQPNAAPPLGYRLENGDIVPEPLEAETVKKIFSLCLSGMTAKQISRELEQLELHTRRNKRFEPRAVTYVLRNPIYSGFTRWSENGRMASLRQFDSPNFIIAKGEHPPLIERSKFLRVQELLDDQEKKSRRGSPAMLSSLLLCSSCGSKMTVQKGKTPSYQCSSYASGKCKHSHSISVRELDGAIVSTLPQRLLELDISTLNLFPQLNASTLGEFFSSSLISPKEKNAILKLFVNKIVYDRENNSANVYFKNPELL